MVRITGIEPASWDLESRAHPSGTIHASLVGSARLELATYGL